VITESKTRQVAPDITVIEISGRLGLGNALLAIENSINRLIQDGTRKLALDLTGLQSIDSSGIGVLVSSSGQMERSGGRLRIAGAQGAVAKSFELVHMGRIAALDPDVESSCRHLADGSARAD
jgi:anti-sigma B factor antagonist